MEGYLKENKDGEEEGRREKSGWKKGIEKWEGKERRIQNENKEFEVRVLEMVRLKGRERWKGKGCG